MLFSKKIPSLELPLDLHKVVFPWWWSLLPCSTACIDCPQDPELKCSFSFDRTKIQLFWTLWNLWWPKATIFHHQVLLFGISFIACLTQKQTRIHVTVQTPQELSHLVMVPDNWWRWCHSLWTWMAYTGDMLLVLLKIRGSFDAILQVQIWYLGLSLNTFLQRPCFLDLWLQKEPCQGTCSQAAILFWQLELQDQSPKCFYLPRKQ